MSDCVICQLWEKLPYHIMHTTPIPYGEAENLVAVGYWLKGQQPVDVAARLCERHALAIEMLDQLPAAPTLVEQALSAPYLESHHEAPAGLVPSPARPPAPPPGPEALPPGTAEGAKVRFPCMGCGQMISTGETHACPGK